MLLHLQHWRIFLLGVKVTVKKVHLSVCSIRLYFPVFHLGNEYVRTLSVKNLLVWDKYLRRGSAGTSKRREFE